MTLKNVLKDMEEPGKGNALMGDSLTLKALLKRVPKKSKGIPPKKKSKKKIKKEKKPMTTATEEGESMGIKVVKTDDSHAPSNPNPAKRPAQKQTKAEKPMAQTFQVRITEDEAADICKKGQVRGMRGEFTISDQVAINLTRDGLAIKQNDSIVSFDGRIAREVLMAIATVYQEYEDLEVVENVTVRRDGDHVVIEVVVQSTGSQTEKPVAPPVRKTAAAVKVEQVEEVFETVQSLTPLSGAPSKPDIKEALHDDRDEKRAFVEENMGVVISTVFSFFNGGEEELGIELKPEMMMKEGAELEEWYYYTVPVLKTAPDKALVPRTIYEAWEQKVKEDGHPLSFVLGNQGSLMQIDFQQMPTKTVGKKTFFLPLPSMFTFQEGRALDNVRVERRKRDAQAWGEENLLAIFKSRKGSKKITDACFEDSGRWNQKMVYALHEGERGTKCSAESEDCVDGSRVLIVIDRSSWAFCPFHGMASKQIRNEMIDAKMAKIRRAQGKEREAVIEQLRADPKLFLSHDMSDGRLMFDLSDVLSGGENGRIPFVDFRAMRGSEIDPRTGDEVEGSKGFLIMVPGLEEGKPKKSAIGYRPVSRETFTLVREYDVNLPTDYHVVGRWEMVEFVRDVFGDRRTGSGTPGKPRKRSKANNKKPARDETPQERIARIEAKRKDKRYGEAKVKPKKESKAKKGKKGESKKARRKRLATEAAANSK